MKLRNHLQKKYRLRFLAACVPAAAGAILTASGPWLLGMATTEIFRGIMAVLNGTGSTDPETVTKLLLYSLAVYAAGAVCTMLQTQASAFLAAGLTFELRCALTDKLHKLPVSYFTEQQEGQILARLTDDVRLLTEQTGQNLVQAVSSVCFLAASCAMMLRIHPLLAGISFLIFPFCALAARLAGRAAKKAQRNWQMEQGRMHTRLEELFAAHDVTTLFGMRESAEREFAVQNRKAAAASRRADLLAELSPALAQMISSAGYVLTILCGAHFAFAGQIQIGGIQAFLHYIRSLSRPVWQLSRTGSLLQSAKPAAERVTAFLDEAEEPEQKAAPQPGRALSGGIVFSGVGFSYPKGPVVLREISLEIRPGETVAVVGETGAGKTTLTSLLLRFYETESGSIRIGGQEIGEIPLCQLRSRFAVVTQEPWLFRGTIAENIGCGRPGVGMEEIVRAAKCAQADAWIRRLPAGYETVADDRTCRLSRGQRQLIALARALCAEPELLILDEAASAVDADTARRAVQAVREQMRGRICLLIAHRLEAVRDADRIVVMRDGCIAEAGTHQELMERGGIYAEMLKSD